MAGVEKKRSGHHDPYTPEPADDVGQYLHVNPVLVAVTRLGGGQATSDVLGVPRVTVASWIKPSRLDRPRNEQIRALGRATGIQPACIFAYYETLRKYRPTLRAYWRYRHELEKYNEE